MNLFEQMSKQLSLLTLNKAFLNQAKDIIQKRVKSGYGVSDLGNKASKVKLKPLSPNYVNWRKGNVFFFRKNGKLVRVTKTKRNSVSAPILGEYGSPARSNLTLTGQMLNAMETREITKHTGSIYIKSTARSPIVLKNGRSLKPSPINNRQLAQLVQDHGRPFLQLAVKEQNILNTLLQKQLRYLLKKYLD